MRASIPSRTYASHVALVSSIHAPSSYLKEERCDNLTKDDDDFDFSFEVNVSIVEYRDKVVGFS